MSRLAQVLFLFPLRLGFLVVCLTTVCWSQKREENVIILNHADSLVGREINGERARELIGNVKFSQGNLVVTCDRAIQYLGSNRIELEGEVEVLDSAMRMVGERGIYYGEQRIAEAFGRVTVEDPGMVLDADHGKYYVPEKRALFSGNVSARDTASILTSDTLIYFREDEHTIALGNVRIRNRSNSVTIFGDRFENFRRLKYSTVTGNPKFIQVDTTTGGVADTLTVTSMLMESFEDTLERLVATDSVTMVRGELAGRAGHATFLTELDSIILRKSPFIWYTTGGSHDNQVSGDSMYIKLRDRKLETVHARGGAMAIARADSLHPNRFNQMHGQELTMYFEDDRLQRIDVNRTATSLYYLFDGQRPNGLNKVSGDRVTISFSDGNIDRIKVVTGPEGQYVPERLVRNREAEYNLPGFNWQTDRPGGGTNRDE